MKNEFLYSIAERPNRTIQHERVNDTVEVFLSGMMAILTLVILGFMLHGCATIESVDPITQTYVASYGANMLQCVKLAHTKEESEDCRAAVREYWCNPTNGPLHAAGACATDGGK